MLGMVIHLQIREKHVENPASHGLSLEMPVADVFGVTVHLQCYSMQDVLWALSLPRLSLCAEQLSR